MYQNISTCCQMCQTISENIKMSHAPLKKIIWTIWDREGAEKLELVSKSEARCQKLEYGGKWWLWVTVWNIRERHILGPGVEFRATVGLRWNIWIGGKRGYGTSWLTKNRINIIIPTASVTQLNPHTTAQTPSPTHRNPHTMTHAQSHTSHDIYSIAFTLSRTQLPSDRFD